MIEKILAFLALVIISVIIGAVISYGVALKERGESLEQGFSKSEVDEDLGTGKGIVHYVTRK